MIQLDHVKFFHSTKVKSWMPAQCTWMTIILDDCLRESEFQHCILSNDSRSWTWVTSHDDVADLRFGPIWRNSQLMWPKLWLKRWVWNLISSLASTGDLAASVAPSDIMWESREAYQGISSFFIFSKWKAVTELTVCNANLWILFWFEVLGACLQLENLVLKSQSRTSQINKVLMLPLVLDAHNWDEYQWVMLLCSKP